ncbi:hypothetical protein V6Z11_D13G111900 [Gossypium hirsutum]
MVTKLNQTSKGFSVSSLFKLGRSCYGKTASLDIWQHHLGSTASKCLVVFINRSRNGEYLPLLPKECKIIHGEIR